MRISDWSSDVCSSDLRVVFYDYDELCLVTECRFRKLPIARHHEEEIADGAWFHVGEHDVFPEQFPRFLGLDDDHKKALFAVHGDTFDQAWWPALSVRLHAGDYFDWHP